VADTRWVVVIGSVDIYQSALRDCARSYAADLPQPNLDEYHRLARLQRLSGINLFVRLNLDSMLCSNGLWSPWPYAGWTEDPDELLITGIYQSGYPGPVWGSLIVAYVNATGGGRADVVSYPSYRFFPSMEVSYRHYGYAPTPEYDEIGTYGSYVDTVSVRTKVQRSGYRVSKYKQSTVTVTH
jgi:hypothetical protein